MADLQRAITAFKNAHDAGDTAAAAKLANLVRQLQGQVQPPEQEPVERTLMGQAGEFFRGIPRGAIGLLETAGIGASAMLPDEEEAYLRDLISGAAESAASSFQPKAGYEDSLAGTVGEALGSTVPFVLTGGLPGVAARVASGVALGSASGAGTARTRAEQAGATGEERAQATALGILPGAAEMVAPARILSRLRKPAEGVVKGLEKAAGPKLATNIASRMGRVGVSATEEGLQEAASEIAQNLIAQGIYDPEQGTFTNTGESLGLGAGVGGLVAAIVELGIRDRSAGVTPPPAAGEEQAPPAPPAPPLRTVNIPVSMTGGGENGVMRLVQEPSGKLFSELVDPNGAVRMRQPLNAASPNAFLDEMGKLEVAAKPFDIKTIVDAMAKASTVTRAPEQQELFDTAEAPVSGPVPTPSTTAEERNAAQPMPPAATRNEQEAAGQMTLNDAIARARADEARAAQEQAQQQRDAGDLFPAELEAATSDAPRVAETMARQQAREENDLALRDEDAKAADSQEQEQLQLDFTPPTEAELVAAGVPKGAPVTKRVAKSKTPAKAKAELTTYAAAPGVAPDVAASVTALADSISVPLLTETEVLAKARENIKRAKPRQDARDQALMETALEKARAAEIIKAEQDKVPVSTAVETPAAPKTETDKFIEQLLGESPGESVVEPVRPSKFTSIGDGRSEAEKELLSLSQKDEKPGDVQMGNGSFAPFDSVVAMAREGIASGEIRPFPAQLHLKLDLAMRDVDRVLEAVKTAKPVVEPAVESTTPVAKEEQAFRTKLTRAIGGANKAQLAQAFQRVMGKAPTGDAAGAISQLPLPKQVDIYNEYASDQGRSEIALPGKFNAVQPKREEAADIPANKRIMQLVEEGATPAQILRAIIKDKDLPQDLRDMAAAMLRAAPDINVPVFSKRFEAVDEVGEYVHPSKGDEAIYLDPRAESVAQTFVHEFVHPMTVNAIARGTPEGKRIVRLFEQYTGQHPESDAYGFENPYEFVAEGITNPKFRSLLKRQNWWGRFVDAIRRVVGLPAAKSGTVEELLDLTKRMGKAENTTRTQKAAEQALTDPSPTANNRFLNVQGAQLNSTSKPMRSKPVRDAVAKVMGTSTGSAAGNAARTVLTWGLPLPALNDYVQSYIRTKGPAYALFADAMKRYTETAVKFEGAMKQFTDGITAQITRMGEWKLKNADKYAAMTDLYFGGSHARVDLTKPESEYVGNPEKLTAYRKLKKQYDAIGPAGQAIYRQMRVIHNRQFKQISQQVFNRVYDATQDKAMATRIQNEFVKQMREKGPLEGYAPMLRPSGKHMLKYVQKNGEPAFEIFTNPNDQAARRQQLLEEGISDKDIKPFIGGDLRAFDGVVPSSFLGQLITTLKESKVEDGDAKTALIESVMALGVAMSPSNSVLERLASRKEVAGYIRDPFWAFQEGTIGLGRKLINMEYGAQLNKEVENMKATRENMGNDATVVSIVDDIAKRAKYSANPSQSWWSNLFTTGTYGWTLGFNVSSAIVDMSSLVLVTGPYLTRTYGFAKTHRVMMAAAKDILGMGTSADVETLVTQGLEGAALQEVLQTLGTKGRDTVRRKTLPSVLNIDFNDPAQQKKYGYLKPLVDKVREAGHSERYSELAESAEFGESNPLSKWSARMGFMMNASERFKREIGLKTAYDLELSTLGANPTPEQMEAAAQKAMDMSLLLNGGSTAVTGARFQQQDVARIAFMYRRFAALQMYLQTKTAYDATMNDDPEVKAAARKFAAYTMLTSAAMVGVKGMPMMGAVAGLWAMYGALFGEEDEDNSLENFLRTHLDPILVEGIPNLLFNANVAGRMEMTNLLIRDSNLPNDATLADIVAAHFGGPAYGSVSRAYRGAGLIADGDIQRGVESMLPASFSNLFKSARFLTEGAVETMRGDVVTEVTPFGALSQALGFAPADYARTMDFNVGDSNAERRIKTKRTGLYEAVYVAYRVGDTGGVAQAIEKIIEFNARYPEFGMTSDGLRQSIKGRDNNTQKMIRGRLPDERMRGNTLERAEDWGF